MHQDAVLVKPLKDCQFYVELLNGDKGVFDVSLFLNNGALQVLRNEHYFQQVGGLFGAVSWPDGQDIALRTLASGLKRIG